MRRFSPLLFILVLVLVLPSAAMAHAPRHGAPAARPQSHSLLAAPRSGAVSGATCTITVLVKDASGNPVVNASVDASTSDYSAGSDTATTNAGGQATVTKTPVTTSGVIDITSADAALAYELLGQTFTDNATITVQPGSVAFSTDTSGLGNTVDVATYGPSGGAYMRLPGTAGFVPAMPASINYAVAKWSAEEGSDWVSTDYAAGTNAPIAVLAGQQSSGQVTIGGSSPRSIWVDSPSWRSGAPGTKVTVELDNWLAPLKADLTVRSESTAVAMPTLAPFVGTTMAKRTFSFTVPKKAKPGDTVDIRATRSDLTVPQDFRLRVTDYFQVCTLVATKTSIAKGGSVRLSGVIPANGAAKKVVLYGRTTKATVQPTKWDAAKAGWKKVATLSASKTGAYKSGLLKPTRTTWYVVRYPGDSSNFEAFTAVLRVAVH